MELIGDLEQKFQNLDTTLNSRAKVYAFYINFNNNYNRINTRIFNESKEKKYENGLNECRQEMLDQLLQKRNEQLEQVNEFKQSSQQNSLSQLKCIQKSIKQNYTSFAKGVLTVLESILFRSKLANPLQLAQLGKYTNLMRNGEKVSLAKVKHLVDLPYIGYRFVHVLPLNQILIYCPNKRNMVVLSKSGDLIRFKELKNFFDDIQVNATNIVVLNEINRIVDVYNFKLELVHSIRLERSYGEFKLNNYEIGLFNRAYGGDGLTIACYNYETVSSKKKEFSLNALELQRILDYYVDDGGKFICKIVDLNDQFIFINGYGFCDTRRRERVNYIILLNRHDNNNIYQCFESDLGSWVIYINQIGSISGLFFQIYEIDGSVQTEPIQRVSRINHINPTSNYKYVYNLNFTANDYSLEFYLY